MAAHRDQSQRHPDLRSVSAAGRNMDKLAIVRSLVGNQADHDAIQVFNGHHPQKARTRRRLAAVRLGRLQAARLRRSATPPFISLCYTCTHGPYNEPGPGFLGTAHAPFRPMGPARDDMILNGDFVDRLAIASNCSRASTPFAAKSMPRASWTAWMHFREQAFGLLTSSQLAEALDLSKEDLHALSIVTGRAIRTFSWTPTAPARAAEPVDGPPIGRGRRSRRDAQLQQVGLARRLNAEGRANNSIFLREKEDFPVFDQLRQRPGRRSARCAASTRIAASSLWASSAERRRSAPRSAATTGPR